MLGGVLWLWLRQSPLPAPLLPQPSAAACPTQIWGHTPLALPGVCSGWSHPLPSPHPPDDLQLCSVPWQGSACPCPRARPTPSPQGPQCTPPAYPFPRPDLPAEPGCSCPALHASTGHLSATLPKKSRLLILPIFPILDMGPMPQCTSSY